LIATSRTPNARRLPTGQRPGGGVHAHLVFSYRVVAFGGRLRRAGVGAGLVALVGLTTWAVASVSVWMAPAYLALMVLIFVTPLGRRPSKSAPERHVEPLDVGDAEVGRSLRVDRTDGAEDNRPAAERDSGPAADEASFESLDSITDPAGSAGAKPKRGRGRMRKAAKPAAEPAPDSASVTWIRVGPGKFVRADASIQAIDPTRVADVAAADVPVTDTPDAVPAIALVDDPVPVAETAQEESVPATDGPDSLDPSTPAEAAPAAPPARQDLHDLSATTPDDVGMNLRTDDYVESSVAEEYGITPSAFGEVSRVPSVAQGPDCHASAMAEASEADLVSEADTDVETSSAGDDHGRPRSRRRILAGRTGRITRGVASAIPGADRASSRRIVRTLPKPRTSVWSPFAPNARLQQATRRAFGRIPHVHRALRPRSPPLR
jgi:hypothetical protein